MISTTENVCQQKKETTSEERVEMECMWDQKSETPYSHHRRDVAYRSNTLFVSGWTSFGSSFKLTVRHWMMALLGTIISSVVGAQPHHSTTDAACQLPAVPSHKSDVVICLMCVSDVFVRKILQLQKNDDVFPTLRQGNFVVSKTTCTDDRTK